jgi:hypothetical protein
LAGISCLFDASSIVFAVMTPLHEHYPVLWSRSHLLTTYAVLATVLFGILGYCWSILEKNHWKLLVAKGPSSSQEQSEQDYARNNESHQFDETALELLEEEEYNEGFSIMSPDAAHTRRIQRQNLHHQPLVQQLLTLDFAVVLTFAAVQMLRCNFYIETVNELLVDVARPNVQSAVQYAQIFSFVLPLGVLFVPLIDGTVKVLGVVNTLHTTNAFGVAFGVLLLIPSLTAQAINFLVFTGFRAFLYATLNTYIALTFGVTTMGRVIGSAFTTAAVVSLLQYPAATLAEDFYDGDFTVVNILFLLAGILLPGGLACYYDRVLQQAFRQEQYNEDESIDDKEKDPILSTKTVSSSKGTKNASRHNKQLRVVGTTSLLLLITHLCATPCSSAWQLSTTTSASRRQWISQAMEVVPLIVGSPLYANASISEVTTGDRNTDILRGDPKFMPATSDRPQISLPTAPAENQPFVQGM